MESTGHQRKLAIPRTLVYFLLFLGYVGISVIWSLDKIAAFKHLILIISSGLIALLIYWNSDSSPNLRASYISLVMLTIFGLFLAAWELSTGSHLAASARFGGVPEYVSTAWYPNENDFSFFLSLLVPMFLTRFLYRSNVFARLFDFALLVAISYVIVVNKTRAALLAELLVIPIILTIYFSRRYLKHIVSRSIRRNLFTAGVFLSTGLTIVFVAFMSNPFVPGSGERSLWIRWQLQYGSLILLFSTIVGVGAGNFGVRFEMLPLPFDRASNAHNWLATLFGEYGFIGTFLFLLIIGQLLGSLLDDYLVNGTPLSLALFGSLLIFPISGLGPDNVFIMPVLWIIIGLGAATVNSRSLT